MIVLLRRNAVCIEYRHLYNCKEKIIYDNQEKLKYVFFIDEKLIIYDDENVYYGNKKINKNDYIKYIKTKKFNKNWKINMLNNYIK